MIEDEEKKQRAHAGCRGDSTQTMAFTSWCKNRPKLKCIEIYWQVSIFTHFYYCTTFLIIKPCFKLLVIFPPFQHLVEIRSPSLQLTLLRYSVCVYIGVIMDLLSLHWSNQKWRCPLIMERGVPFQCFINPYVADIELKAVRHVLFRMPWGRILVIFINTLNFSCFRKASFHETPLKEKKQPPKEQANKQNQPTKFAVICRF